MTRASFAGSTICLQDTDDLGIKVFGGLWDQKSSVRSISLSVHSICYLGQISCYAVSVTETK
jgi:hypothetical protein